jgi:hypothetical protein
VHPVLLTLCGWIAAQPILCVAWAHVMRARRAVGGN